MQQKNLESGVSCQEHSLSQRGKCSTVLHPTEVRQDDRDTSREVTGGLEESRLGAKVTPLFTSHLLFLVCLRMTSISPFKN